VRESTTTADVETTPDDACAAGADERSDAKAEKALGRSAQPKPGDAKPSKRSLVDRFEAFMSRLSTKNNFWHRICSLFWLPYAFRSGIRMKRVDEKSFTAVLPFKKFNRNFYNAMAGAALLGNSEIAGGMYVFGACGGDYTVVCKHLDYKFLRPCFGPAIYRIKPLDDIEALVAQGGEFNVSLRMDVVQQLPLPEKPVNEQGEPQTLLPRLKDKRVGRVTVTFHVTPKEHLKQKGRWQKGRTFDPKDAQRIEQARAAENGE